MKTRNGIKRLQSKTVKVNKAELTTYVAKVSRNFRNNGGTKQVLLRGVMTDTEEFRDHCWVNESKSLMKALDTKHANNNKTYIVEFKAKEKSYNYQNTGVMKKTLDHICDIKILGRA